MDEIERIFSGQLEVKRICASIVSYVANQPTEKYVHLTYTLLKRVSDSASDRELLLAIQYLSGVKANLLEMRYEFVDDLGEYHPIDKAIVAKATKDNQFFHPLTGESLPDFSESLLVYFTATDDARRTLMKSGAP